MISVLLIWIYILITTYLTGFLTLRLMAGKSGYVVKNRISYIFAGLSFLTVYSQFFSLFTGVGLAANIGVLVICLLTVIVYKKQIYETIKNLNIKNNKGKYIAIVILFLFFAFGTSYGIMHVDSDLYHAQSIRWIEEYGVVKGLGNIHTRLAYNSASFCLSALYSVSFVGGQSFHVVQGFSAFLLAVKCLDMFSKGKVFKPELSNFARIAAIYYLLNIYDEMVSPASDYFMVTLLISLVIMFLELVEDNEKKAFPYGLLSLFGLVILTIKLSGALIVLICIYPVILFIKDKDIKSIIKFSLAGIITIVPFFVRNIILSGYLIYPFTAIDIFNFDYKIPFDIARFDEREIQVYGRGYSDVSRYDESITKWIGDWFSGLDMINKAAFILAIISIISLVGIAVYALLRKKKELYPYLLLMSVISLSFGYWMITAPIIRYGCVFLWLTPLLNIGMLYRLTLSRIDRGYILKGFIILFLLYKGYAFGNEWIDGFKTDYMICQQDYGHYELLEYEVQGVKFYMPVSGGLTGYDPFPTIPYETEFRLLGTDISEGFQK